VEKIEIEKRVLDFLQSIETGKIRLSPIDNPQRIHTGNVKFKADNGWYITIFNDLDDWDYIDNIVTNTGLVIGFESLDAMLSVRHFRPSDDSIVNNYQIQKSKS
jgi:hypothetical protein